MLDCLFFKSSVKVIEVLYKSKLFFIKGKMFLKLQLLIGKFASRLVL